MIYNQDFLNYYHDLLKWKPKFLLLIFTGIIEVVVSSVILFLLFIWSVICFFQVKILKEKNHKLKKIQKSFLEFLLACSIILNLKFARIQKDVCGKDLPKSFLFQWSIHSKGKFSFWLIFLFKNLEFQECIMF